MAVLSGGGEDQRMWLLFGNKSRFREVPGGRAVERHCAECRQVRTFVECDVTDKVSVFLVPVFDMSSRRLVCRECGADQELSQLESAKPTDTRDRSPAGKLPARPSEK